MRIRSRTNDHIFSARILRSAAMTISAGLLTCVLALPAVFLLALVNVSPCFADGFAFKKGGQGSWDLFKEGSQTCFINHQNGVQKMLLNVGFNDKFEENKAVWIFPVPASETGEVKIDIIRSAPNLQGTDIIKSIDRIINKYFDRLYCTQLFPLPIIAMNEKFASMELLFERLRHYAAKEIQKVEKFGITTELLSASGPEDLLRYLEAHNVKIGGDLNGLTGEYSGSKYLFVVSWLSNEKKYKENIEFPVEVAVTFKTPKIFFPLRLTSIYKDSIIPVNIFVIGAVTPELYGEISRSTGVNYYHCDRNASSAELSDFFFGRKEHRDFNYTSITISAASANFKKDLWMTGEAPPHLAARLLIKEKIDLLFILLFIVLSSVSSIISAWLNFTPYRPRSALFGLLGLANVFSVIGLIIAARSVGLKKLFRRPPDDNEAQQKAQKNLMISAVVAFIVFAVILVVFFPFFTVNAARLSIGYLVSLSVFILLAIILNKMIGRSGPVVNYAIVFSIVFVCLCFSANSMLFDHLDGLSPFK